MMRIIYKSEIFLVLSMCLSNQIHLTIISYNETREIFQHFSLSNYSHFISPPVQGRGKTVVHLGVTFHGLSFVTSSQYRVEIDIHMIWVDNRLKFDLISNESLALSAITDEFIWEPDLWIADDLSGESLYPVDPQIILYPSGEVQHNRRVTLDMFCPMRYWFFPFDKQVCNMIFELYAYSNEETSLKWINEPVRYGETFFSTGFSIEEFHPSYEEYEGGVTGTFDNLELTIHLERKFVTELYEHYVPLNLVVIASMTAFWIDHRCVPARVTIPLIVVFTHQQLHLGIKNNLPVDSHILFIEYYYIFSMLFVFAVMVEYCVVEYFKFRDKKKKVEKRKQFAANSLSMSRDGVLKPERENHSLYNSRKQRKYRKLLVHPIDAKCRIIFPCIFVIYNLVYFLVNIFGSNYKDV